MEKNNILVSVLVPAYNVEKYLPQCLDSIVNQTYQHLQVVVVDDGSKDNTLSIAQEYAAKYSFVEVYHQENAGVATARNNLLSHVKGDYVLFVDSDDWIEPNMIGFLVKKVEEHQVDVVTCGMVVNDTIVKKGYKQECWNQEQTIQKFLFHKELSGSLWNKLIKTSLLHNVVFHCGISYGEDALFCWSAFQRINTLVWTDRQLYHYRKNTNSISRQKWSPDKKGTGHFVWRTICNDVAKHWPQYLDIAQARFALEDMWALYFASLCNYKYDEHIKERQDNIKKSLHCIKKYKIDGVCKYIIAVILCRWYGFGSLIRKIKK